MCYEQTHWKCSITIEVKANSIEVQYRDILPDDIRSAFDKAIEALPQEHLCIPITGDEMNSLKEAFRWF